MTNVLILRVPAAEGGDLIDIRDYILESLERGVLILGQGVSWEVAQLPDLGGVALAAEPDALEAPVLPAVTFTGSGAREKRRIRDALVRYREENGLGSLEALAKPDGPTLHDLRAALSCEKLPMEVWRRIGAALDRLGDGQGEG